MRRVPDVRKILMTFPWGRIEKDGTFADNIAEACYGVLGSTDFGYWSAPGGRQSHLPQQSPWQNPTISLTNETFKHGYQLLRSEQVTDKTGWKLDQKLIPKLTFDGGSEPVIATKVNIVDWNSWYEWRQLPKESPVALRMHYPMSAYQLLVHVLKVAHPSWGSVDQRKKLNVHYLGAELELNFVPLFSELALLLPYTDIELTFFGVAVHDLMKKAGPTSIAYKAKEGKPIHAYSAPSACGSGSICILLYHGDEVWTPQAVADSTPDALIGLNAGLLSYASWFDVIVWSHATNTPFAVTEYAEQSAEQQRNSFRSMIHSRLRYLSGISGQEIVNVSKPREYPLEFNPFQRPGQRQISKTRLPNVSNGFTLRVVGKNDD